MNDGSVLINKVYDMGIGGRLQCHNHSLPMFLLISSLVSVLQCTAPMSQGLSQPSPQQSPHPAPQLMPHPGSHPAPHVMPHPASQPVAQLQRQEIINSTEALGQPGLAPNQHPFPASALRSSSPKPDASELYIKSRALLDSKRKCSQ